MTREGIYDEGGELAASFCPTDVPLSDKGRAALEAVVRAVRKDMAASAEIVVPDRPSPFELWQQAKGDRAEYRRLLWEHGHLVKREPGDDPNLPCGWPGRATGGVVTEHVPIGQHGCVIEPSALPDTRQEAADA